MFDIIDHVAQILPKYMLVLGRISGLVLTFPILSSGIISKRVKVYLAITFTLIVAPIVGEYQGEFTNLIGVFYAVGQEVAIGMMIGFGTKVIFNAFMLAGNFISRKMGLLMGKVIDPTSKQQVPIFSQFLIMFITLFFFASNGHHLFIETIFENFNSIAPGQGIFPGAAGRNIVKSGTLMFDIAVKFAGPTVVLLLILEVAVGITVRVMPQMNAFFITLPLRIAGGLFAMMSSLKIFQLLFDNVYSSMVSYIGSAIFQIKGG